MMKKLLALALCLLLCLQPFSTASFVAVLAEEGADGLSPEGMTDVTPPSASAVVLDTPDAPSAADPLPVAPEGSADPVPASQQGEAGEPSDPSEGLPTENAVTSPDPVDPLAPSGEQPLPADPAPFAQGYARVLARAEVKLSGGAKAELASGDLVYADGLDADGALTIWFALPGGDVVKTQLDAALLQPLAEEEAEAFLLAAQETEEDGQAYARTPLGVMLPTSGKHLTDAPKKPAEDTPAQAAPAPGQSRAALAIHALTVDKASAALGEALTWTMTASGGGGELLYNFSIYNQDNVPVLVGVATPEPTITYTPEAPGYYIAVGVVNDAQWATAVGGGGLAQVLSANPVTIQSIDVNRSTVQFGEALTWTMTTSGGTGPLLYNFSIYNQDNVPVFIGESSPEPTVTYTPTVPGYYIAVGVVSDAAYAVAQAGGGLAQVLSADPVTIQRIDVNKSTVQIGEALTWTMTTSGGTAPLLYNYAIYNQDNVPMLIGEPASEPTITYTPTVPGYYIAVGVVTDAAYTVAQAGGGLAQALSTDPVTIQRIDVNKSTVQIGEALTWTMTTAGGQAPLLYNYSIYNQDGVPVYVGAATASPTITYTPTAPGYYVAVGVVTDAHNTSAQGGSGIANAQFAINLTSPSGAVYTGSTATWQALVGPGMGAVTYTYDIYRNGEKIRTVADSSSTTCTHNMTGDGVYQVVVTVRSGAQVLATASSAYTLVLPYAAAFSAEAYDWVSSSGVFLSTMNLLGATGYRIFRAEYGVPASRVQLAVVSEISAGVSFYNDETLTKERVYSYSIQPYKLFNGVPVYGEETSAVHVFASALPALQSLTQGSVTATTSSVNFAWQAVPGASGYVVLRVRQIPSTPPDSESIEIGYLSAMAWSALPTGTKHSFNITPYVDLGGGVRALGATEMFLCEMITFNAPTQITFSQATNTSVQVLWTTLNATNQPNYAAIDGVAIYRSTSTTGPFAHIGTAAKTESTFLDTDLTIGQTYYYTLCALRDGRPLDDPYGMAAVGLPSNAVSYTMQDMQTTVHRALLIGERNYPNYSDPILEGPDNDINAMANLLSGPGSAYAGHITKKLNATRQEILSGITTAFAGATAQDVSLFYFSGHGITSGTYAGALAPSDYNGYANALITAPQLASALSAVPGTVVVILDSCGSGSVIYARDAGGQEVVSVEAFDPVQFNKAFINAFASAEPKARTGELLSSKFKVFTASAYNQLSYTWTYYISSVGAYWPFGHMTYHLTMGAGLVHGTSSVLPIAPADSNSNGIVTLLEAYNYVAPRVGIDGAGAAYAQTIMIYPTNGDFDLFAR